MTQTVQRFNFQELIFIVHLSAFCGKSLVRDQGTMAPSQPLT